MILARRAFTEVPIEESNAVTHEPIFEPKIKYSTAFPPPPIIKPALAIAIITVVTALDDCTNAVNTIPKINNKNGLFNEASKSVTAGLLAYPFIVPDITSKPKKTIPNPANASPILFTLSVLQNISIATPINSNEINSESIGNACNAASCAVIVVPIFAPIITAAA